MQDHSTALCGCGCGAAVGGAYWKAGRRVERRFVALHHRRSDAGQFAVRFWARVEKTDGCWLWRGYAMHKGYGVIHRGRRPARAHRVAWELTYGPIPAGLHVLHNCPGGDNRRCVRPSHLWLGTTADNNADRLRKGRYRTLRGSPVSDLEAEAIRRAYRSGGVTMREMARRFRTSETTVFAAIHEERRFTPGH